MARKSRLVQLTASCLAPTEVLAVAFGGAHAVLSVETQAASLGLFFTEWRRRGPLRKRYSFECKNATEAITRR